MMSTATCDHCGDTFTRSNGSINRAKKIGAKLYCSRICTGLARRQYKSTKQKRAEKRLYDMEYREKNRAALKAKKAAYHLKNYDPAKAAVDRKKRAKQHAEYCRRPEYKQWKQQYDRRYWAKKNYGGFWESFLILQDIENEIVSRFDRAELKYLNGATNKTQTRRRDYDRSHSNQPEDGPLENPGPIA